MRRGDVGAQLVLRHPFLERLERGAERFDGDVAGLLHQRQLGRALDHAAAGRDHFRVDELGRRRFLLHAVEDEEAQPLFDADAAAGGAAIPEDAGDLPVGAFVFLPHAHFGALRHQLARAFFLEARRHPRQLALRRNHAHERPLAEAPAHAGEIEHARSAFEHDRADLVRRHQLLRLLHARRPLFFRDRLHVRRHRLEGRKGRMRAAGRGGRRLRLRAEQSLSRTADVALAEAKANCTRAPTPMPAAALL